MRIDEMPPFDMHSYWEWYRQDGTLKRSGEFDREHCGKSERKVIRTWHLVCGQLSIAGH